MITSDEAAMRFGVERDAFLAWARQVRLRPAGWLNGRRCVWRWADVLAADGEPTGAQRMVDYTCKVCQQPRRGPFAADACYGCIRHQQLTARERGRPTPCVICGKPTRHAKPWCTDHIDHSPYVKWLLGRLHS